LTTILPYCARSFSSCPASSRSPGRWRTATGLRVALEEHQPDIIVLDITLPPVSGIALASQLTNAGCPAKIVFLTVHSDPDYVRAALAAGAIGYVVKTRLSMDLVPALRAALDDTRFISPSPELEGWE
jgi:DNA-binding NarL/FixJ family response regulator